MGSLHYLKYAKRMFYKRGASPLYFVYFVTENCNAFCKHCLLGQRTERVTDELTIDEIEKVSASMGDMLFFTPTGGEPFLRRDLPEIVKIFHINNHALNVGIPTNGSLTARVLRSVKTMLDENPDLDLHIDVSIDGLPELHDEIRGVPGLFNRAIETYQQLREPYPRSINTSSWTSMITSSAMWGSILFSACSPVASRVILWPRISISRNTRLFTAPSKRTTKN